MRGQRAPPLNENGDGEVDENFWAQAAADQAAGLATSGDEGGVPPPPPLPFSRRLSDTRC
jgi:condensin complex subunit 2